jgi:hypothetical protein
MFNFREEIDKLYRGGVGWNSRRGVSKRSWSKDAVVSGVGIYGNLKTSQLGVVGKY